MVAQQRHRRGDGERSRCGIRLTARLVTVALWGVTMFGEASGFVAPMAGRLPAAKLALSGVPSVSRSGTECVPEIQQSVLYDCVVARAARAGSLHATLSEFVTIGKSRCHRTRNSVSSTRTTQPHPPRVSNSLASSSLPDLIQYAWFSLCRLSPCCRELRAARRSGGVAEQEQAGEVSAHSASIEQVHARASCAAGGWHPAHHHHNHCRRLETKLAVARHRGLKMQTPARVSGESVDVKSDSSMPKTLQKVNALSQRELPIPSSKIPQIPWAAGREMTWVIYTKRGSS